jgi:cytochrome c oxidase assembly protein subunit 15
MSTAFANSVPPNNRPIARFAWFVVFYNILVIVWGALVRASGSGAGCGNRWPLCNGQIIPVSPGFHTIIEFTHRMMVGGSTLLVFALLLWTFRTTVKHQAARALAVAARFWSSWATSPETSPPAASFCSPSTSATL